ncbi:MAG TPA: hypothetical protein VIV34_05670 [Pseudolabrys sp.]
MSKVYVPIMRALVVAALVAATATLMFVTVNTARATAHTAVIRAGRVTTPALPAMPEKPDTRLRFLNS